MNKSCFLILLLLTACQPVQGLDDDFIKVSSSQWVSMNTHAPYPFTAESGEIACSMNEVYFYPDDTANDESQIGWPLNDSAKASLEQDGLTPTVTNVIKPDADLAEAVQIGLDHCKKVESQVASFNS